MAIYTADFLAKKGIKEGVSTEKELNGFDLFQLLDDFKSEIEEEHEEVVDSMKDKIFKLNSELEKSEEKNSELTDRINNLEENEKSTDEVEDFIPDTLCDEMKNKVLINFKKNLSLEQLEHIQKLVKKTHFVDKNYIEH